MEIAILTDGMWKSISAQWDNNYRKSDYINSWNL